MSFFKAIKEGIEDVWIRKSEAMFQELKAYLSNPLLLAILKPDEKVIYLSVCFRTYNH